MKRIILLLLIYATNVLSVEAKCGEKSQFAIDNNLTFECFYDPTNNISGFFYQNNKFTVIYHNEKKGITCRHEGYTGNCSTFYECIIMDEYENYSYICKTKKNADDIKKRLKNAQ